MSSFSDLPTLADQGRSRCAPQKGPSRKRLKGRRDRAELKVKRAVRAECVERDGYCFVGNLGIAGCKGPSEWAHFAGHRRSQTRGMAPARRHDTRWTAMLCQRHHQYEEDDVYTVVYHSDRYADGPCSWVKGNGRRSMHGDGE